MNGPAIVLSGNCPELDGLRWQSPSQLCIGRGPGSVHVVLNDASVAPRHAEILCTRHGWLVRDLGTKTGTVVNGEPLNGRPRLLKDKDDLKIGRLLLRVQLLPEETSAQAPVAPSAAVIAAPAPPTPEAPAANEELALPEAAEQPQASIKASGSFLTIQARARHSWEQAVEVVTPPGGQGAWKDVHLRALLRTGYAVSRVASLDELLSSVLDDVVNVLDAQRGAILLVDEQTGLLSLSALKRARRGLRGKETHSQTLAQLCFLRGESLLCADVKRRDDIQSAESITHGAMTSLICALLRTPRQAIGVLHLDRGPMQEPFSREEFNLADAIAATISGGIESARLVETQRLQFVQTVAALGRAVEVRDRTTANHTTRVTEYALLLADRLGVPADQQQLLRVGTPLHDIGKIGIDDAILRKPDRLTVEEFEEMKSHTLKGAAILEEIPSLRAVIPIARNHHERWDGRGYPDGLAREQISLLARIVAVADAFDAMSSDRPYRRALTTDEAFAEISKHSGSHFDPACVKAFLERRPQVEAIHREKSSPQG